MLHNWKNALKHSHPIICEDKKASRGFFSLRIRTTFLFIFSLCSSSSRYEKTICKVLECKVIDKRKCYVWSSVPTTLSHTLQMCPVNYVLYLCDDDDETFSNIPVFKWLYIFFCSITTPICKNTKNVYLPLDPPLSPFLQQHELVLISLKHSHISALFSVLRKLYRNILQVYWVSGGCERRALIYLFLGSKHGYTQPTLPCLRPPLNK